MQFTCTGMWEKSKNLRVLISLIVLSGQSKEMYISILQSSAEKPETKGKLKQSDLFLKF